MMTEMIASSARAFWHLGDPLYLGPIAREAFAPVLRNGLESTGAKVEDEAITRTLDLSEDVPYNVQQLASLTVAQKRTLKLIVGERGDFQLTELARRHGIPRTTVQRALQVLEAQHSLRRDFSPTGVTWRLEDPFMRGWLIELQAQ